MEYYTESRRTGQLFFADRILPGGLGRLGSFEALSAACKRGDFQGDPWSVGIDLPARHPWQVRQRRERTQHAVARRLRNQQRRHSWPTKTEQDLRSYERIVEHHWRRQWQP